MYYQEKEFRSYDDMYHVSADGDVYSTYKKGLLKQAVDHDGYRRVDIHGKHMKVHKLVYLVWNGNIPSNMQINHKDDNKDNNHCNNLYLGSQKENIHDCIQNGHRTGHVIAISVYDRVQDQILLYPSISMFLNSTGHSVKNGSLSHVMQKKWFKERYEIVQKEGVSTNERYRELLAQYHASESGK